MHVTLVTSSVTDQTPGVGVGFGLGVVVIVAAVVVVVGPVVVGTVDGVVGATVVVVVGSVEVVGLVVVGVVDGVVVLGVVMVVGMVVVVVVFLVEISVGLIVDPSSSQSIPSQKFTPADTTKHKTTRWITLCILLRRKRHSLNKEVGTCQKRSTDAVGKNEKCVTGQQRPIN
jgi:hypothetical protein